MPYRKAFPILPSMLPCPPSAGCLEADGFLVPVVLQPQGFSMISLCLGLCPENISVTYGRSSFSPFQFIWLLGGSICEHIS